MGQKNLWMSFLLISKMEKNDQRKRKATKKKRLAPISWKDPIKCHLHEPTRKEGPKMKSKIYGKDLAWGKF